MTKLKRYWAIDEENRAKIEAHLQQAMTELKVKAKQPKPGLELDRQIAIEVLGMKQDTDMGGPRAWWFEIDSAIPGDLPHFSTDMRMAWAWLAERFRFCVVPWGGQWTAVIPGHILIDADKFVSPTAAHAICLAALYYKKIEDETP